MTIFLFPICRQYLRILELVVTGGWMPNFVQQEHVLILVDSLQDWAVLL